MDRDSAERFKKHANEAIKELSSALLVAHEARPSSELLGITRMVGDIIARVDGLLHLAIYTDHPDLNDFREQE